MHEDGEGQQTPRAVCPVCPRHCAIAPGESGFCRARTNVGGQVVCSNYGRLTSLALDPVEKKPLAMWRPGTYVLSAGSYGCNMACPFCQNDAISMASEADVAWQAMGPDELVAAAERLRARDNRVCGIAFTYNEPLVGWEYVRDCARLAHDTDLAVVLVSNGMACPPVVSELAGLVDEARAAIDEVRGSYDADVRGVLEELATQVGDAAAQADAVQGSLSAALCAARDAARGAEGTLGDAQTSLDETADAIEKSAGRLGDLRERLSAALATGDVEQVRRVLATDPSELADFVAAPVDVERTAIFPVENNGSAMAPFYTTLAIWIGGVVLCALVRATPSAEALAETGCSHAQAYVGRLLLFCAVGLAQAALICGGDLFYLGVQCEHPWLFLLVCLASSLVYVNLIFSLTASFGDVGKAVAVVLMVIQVAGSGGTFPPQMLPPAFQAVYAWLPFVHSENAMRAAMFGIWEGDIWRELAVLLAYLVPALLLGLVLRRPVIRLNERLEERLEETRLM